MKKIIIISLLALYGTSAFAQNVSISASNTPAHAKSMLDVISTTKGMLIPRMLASEKNAITLSSAAQGLMIYQTDGSQGIYINLSITTTPLWDYIPSNTLTSTIWSTTGNGGLTYPTNWLGTVNNSDLVIKTNNIRKLRLKTDGALYFYNPDKNTFLGDSCGASITTGTGIQNTFIGYRAGYLVSTQVNATFVGASAGVASSTAGTNNTFLGAFAGKSITTGSGNTLLGTDAGFSLTGGNNTLVGNNAGRTSAATNNNCFVGKDAGYLNSAGNNNAYLGAFTGYNMVTDGNTFVGYAAGQSNNNVASLGNTFIGSNAGNKAGPLNMGTYITCIGNTSGQLNYTTAAQTNITCIGNGSNTQGLVAGDAVIIGNSSVTAVGIGTPSPTMPLHIVSTDAMIIPSGTTAQRPGTPANGMIRYNSSLTNVESYDATAAAWRSQLTSNNFWGTSGNSGFTGNTNWMGTTDAVDLIFKSAGTQVMRISSTQGNISIGAAALSSVIKLNNDFSTALTTANTIGQQINLTQTAASANTAKGMSFTGTYSGGATHNGFNGIDVTAQITGGGTVTNAYAYKGSGSVGGTVSDFRGLDITATANSGTIGTLSGLFITDPGGVGAGLTTHYGIYIANIAAGSTNYAIYSNGGQSYHAGNLGLNVAPPTRALDVNGNARLGTNGTTITNIIKATVAKDLASIAANSDNIETFAVTNASTTASVTIAPANALNDGIHINYARVSAAGTVEVKFRNSTAGAIDVANMNWYITVIE